MLSRVAESLYWMTRYLERAEDTARLVRVSRHLLLDFPGQATVGWASLIAITGGKGDFDGHYDEPSEANVLAFLCADRHYGGSILASLAAARENLRTTREVMPREIWEEINQLYLRVNQQIAEGINQRRLDEFLKIVIRGCQTLTGQLEGSLSHTPARTFCAVGRYIERADMTTRILDVRSANLLPRTPGDSTPFENLQWMSVLKSLSAHQMYRQQIRHRVRGRDVMRFILQDELFPRTIARCLADLRMRLGTLPRCEGVCATVGRLQEEVRAQDAGQLADSLGHLHELMDELQVGLNEIHEQIRATWFAGVESPAPVIPG
jgi:uncharacterized alpha-E superfamily protein